MNAPLFTTVTRKMTIDGQEYTYEYKMLDTNQVLGYINHRLYTDVNSYAVLSKSGKKAVVVEVEIPLKKCYNLKQAREDGVPEGIAILGEPFEVVYKWKKWRTPEGEVISSLEDPVAPHCGYYYDLNF